VWIALEQANADGHGAEQMLPRLEALVQFAQSLDGRLSADGMGGIAGTLALYRRLQSVLDTLSDVELARAREEVRALERWLASLAHMLDDVARLKAALGAGL
jgi:hypothetical protein